MVRSSTRWLLLAFLSVEFAKAVPATERTLDLLERRQNKCSASPTQSCQAVDSNLPSNFCCPTGTSCYSLDTSSTALCCPDGATCTVIQPISCNVTLEDPITHPTGPVFTTRLTDALPSCSGNNNKCCPFGYECSTRADGTPFCQIIASKAITQIPNSAVSSTSRISSSATSTSVLSTSTSKATGALPASATSLDSTKPSQPSQSSNPFPATVFLAGFFPGMLVGALGVLAWVIITGRHRRTDDNTSVTSSVYQKKPYISGPVPVNSHSTRTDFLRRGNGKVRSAMSLFSKRTENGGTPGLPFDNWKMPTPPEQNNIPDQPMGRQIQAGPGAKLASNDSGHPTVTRHPVTPERQIYGEQAGLGTETIRVYSPRNMEVPPTAVAPLRGMNSRDRPRSNGVGNSFFTADNHYDIRPTGLQGQTPVAHFEPSYEMLTPARYEAPLVQKRPRLDNTTHQSRPDTTFTTMLEAINFPDPMNQRAPQMPQVPQQYRR